MTSASTSPGRHEPGSPLCVGSELLRARQWRLGLQEGLSVGLKPLGSVALWMLLLSWFFVCSINMWRGSIYNFTSDRPWKGVSIWTCDWGLIENQDRILSIDRTITLVQPPEPYLNELRANHMPPVFLTHIWATFSISNSKRKGPSAPQSPLLHARLWRTRTMLHTFLVRPLNLAKILSQILNLRLSQIHHRVHEHTWLLH